MTAPEAGVEVLAAGRDARRFLRAEGHDAALVAMRAGGAFFRQQREKRFAPGLAEPVQRAARHFHIGPPFGQGPAPLFGMNQVLEGGRSVAPVAVVQMQPDQLRAARIHQRMVPGQDQVPGPVGVPHQIERQPRTPAGVQVAFEDRRRQHPKPGPVAILMIVFEKNRAGLRRRAPERGENRQRAGEAHAGQPVQDRRSFDTPAQPFHIQTVLQPEGHAADVTRQPGPPQLAVLAVHIVVTSGQSNLAGRVRHEQWPPRRSG